MLRIRKFKDMVFKVNEKKKKTSYSKLIYRILVKYTNQLNVKGRNYMTFPGEKY